MSRRLGFVRRWSHWRRSAAGSGVAQAQWALVAKRAIGRVEQMSQQSKDASGPSYDSAAVMLEAPADKV